MQNKIENRCTTTGSSRERKKYKGPKLSLPASDDGKSRVSRMPFVTDDKGVLILVCTVRPHYATAGNPVWPASAGGGGGS